MKITVKLERKERGGPKGWKVYETTFEGSKSYAEAMALQYIHNLQPCHILAIWFE